MCCHTMDCGKRLMDYSASGYRYKVRRGKYQRGQYSMVLQKHSTRHLDYIEERYRSVSTEPTENIGI